MLPHLKAVGVMLTEKAPRLLSIFVNWGSIDNVRVALVSRMSEAPMR